MKHQSNNQKEEHTHLTDVPDGIFSFTLSFFCDKLVVLMRGGTKFMKSLIILINKLIYMIGKMLGRGSTLPGQIALKLDKNILKKVALPDDVIVVTGSSR